MCDPGVRFLAPRRGRPQQVFRHQKTVFADAYLFVKLNLTFFKQSSKKRLINLTKRGKVHSILSIKIVDFDSIYGYWWLLQPLSGFQRTWLSIREELQLFSDSPMFFAFLRHYNSSTCEEKVIFKCFSSHVE